MSSTRRAAHFPCFDGLRAFAALSVLVVHTTFSSGFTMRSGWGIYTARAEIGVSVFFLISGFLLYRPMVAAHLAGERPMSARAFLARRALRIVPAYWLALTVIGYGLHAVNMGDLRGAVLHYGFLQIYSREHILGGITQAWSLCTEVSFYVFLPAYALALRARRRSPERQLRVELAGIGALLVVSFGFRAWLFLAHPPMADQMVVWLPSYLDLFAAGMVLALLSSWFTSRGTEPRWLAHPAQPWVSWSLAAATYWAVSHARLPISPLYRMTFASSLVRQELYGLFALFLLLPAVFGPQDRGLVRGVLRWRPVALVGVVSYGVYLWHQAWVTELFDWTHRRMFHLPTLPLMGATFVLAVAGAGLSYAGVERAFLRLKPGRRRAGAGRPGPSEPTGVPVPVAVPVGVPGTPEPAPAPALAVPVVESA